MARPPRLRPLHELPPPQAWARLQRLRRLLRERGRHSPLDLLVSDALGLLATLIAARSWMRHDPGCDHRRPSGTGPTRCTCGLTATLRARFSDGAGVPEPLSGERSAPGAPQPGGDLAPAHSPGESAGHPLPRSASDLPSP